MRLKLLSSNKVKIKKNKKYLEVYLQILLRLKTKINNKINLKNLNQHQQISSLTIHSPNPQQFYQDK